VESHPVKAGVNGTEDQVRHLEIASQDPGLTSLVSPVVAASFGVIPVRREPGRVTLATFPWVNPAVVGLLEEILGATVTPVPFEEGLMAHYLSRIFLKGNKGINFQTFLEEDFLVPSNLEALTQEKKDDIRGRCHLPEDQIIACDLSYRSLLTPLDGPEGRMAFETGSLTPAYRKTASRIYVDPDVGYTEETVLLVREGYSYRGAEFNNGFRGAAVSALPHVIHPSEMQIARIGSGGAMTFYIYDKMETVKPGKSRTWSVCYHYLSFGRRYRRDLTLRLNEHRPWPRGAVHPLESDPPLRPADLRRWFGHDWDET
jgi:hypothetical protein